MRKKKFLLLLMTLFLLSSTLNAARDPNDQWQKTDMAGDKHFSKHDFDGAIKLYQQALKEADGTDGHDAMTLKLARVYVMFQNYATSAEYYQELIDKDAQVLGVRDVCNYLDALRRMGNDRQAEIVARRYSFIAEYSNNQRYRNTMNALSVQRHYLTKTDTEYIVNPLKINTSAPEFWIGRYEGELFYASSRSPFQDPHKLFYHRSNYYPMTTQTESIEGANFSRNRTRSFVDYIPTDLQNGPLSFNENSTLMVVTSLIYNNQGIVTKPEEQANIFTTQLLFSQIDPKRKGWSAFKPLFTNGKGRKEIQTFSDAHPFFFNDNNSLLFVSNRSGGYGGMDIYFTNWDNNTKKWSEPRNLGPSINTEGDELFPMYEGGWLRFSSNGHEGFGGYDLYKIMMDNEISVGGVKHLPYPVNTPFNELMMYSVNAYEGYLISDRDGRMDDIFSYLLRGSVSSGETNYGVSEVKAISSGMHEVVENLQKGEFESQSLSQNFVTESMLVGEAYIVLSVYFDFNSTKLNDEAVINLQDFITQGNWPDQNKLRLVGYADEMGTDMYNKELSLRRAKVIADCLVKGNISTPMLLDGRGSIQLTEQERREELAKLDSPQPKPFFEFNRRFIGSLELIKVINRKARRVDIIIEK